MKTLKSILEGISPWGSHLVWNIKRTINDNYSGFRELYTSKVRKTLIELVLECGENDKWHTFFFNPVKIKFDYNIKNGFTPGLICGIWLDKDNEPILFVDCMDGGKLFGISIDKIVESRGLLRLRNNVLIGSENIYDLLNSPYLERQITQSECQKLRKEELDRFSSDGGQLADSLRECLKKHDDKKFIDILTKFVETNGKDFTRGKCITLKRGNHRHLTYINEIYLIKGTLWVNVRKLGDISDDDEEVRISEILNSKKLTLHYKGEEFIVDRGSLEDMVDDLEQFLINRK